MLIKMLKSDPDSNPERISNSILITIQQCNLMAGLEIVEANPVTNLIPIYNFNRKLTIDLED